MTLWPFIPQDEVREVLAWKSGVIRTYSAEQRQRFLSAPRQGLEYEHQFTSDQFARAQAIIYGAGQSLFTLPNWPDAIALYSWPAGQQTIEIDASARDFRIGSQALLIQDDRTWELLDVEDGGGGAVDVSAAAPAAITYLPAIIVPLVSAYLLKGLPANRQHPTVSTARLSWLVTTNTDLSAAHDFDTYRSYPVMTDRSVVLSGFDDEIERQLDEVDNGLAAPYREPINAQPEWKSLASWSTSTKAELWRVRQWLHTCKGKQKAFWLPTWNEDLTLTANISSADTVLHIETIGYPDYYTVQDVMIQTLAGARIYRRVTVGVTESGGEVLTLGSAVGANILMSEIDLICFLNLARFSSDRVEIAHRAGGADISVPVVGVPQE